MSLLEDVAERDGWRCWVCDEPVDAGMSVNDPRGPSVDSRTADKKAKVAERLAHRACNTRKGAVKVVIAWPDHLYVVEPAPRAQPGSNPSTSTANPSLAASRIGSASWYSGELYQAGRDEAGHEQEYGGPGRGQLERGAAVRGPLDVIAVLSPPDVDDPAPSSDAEDRGNREGAETQRADDAVQADEPDEPGGRASQRGAVWPGGGAAHG